MDEILTFHDFSSAASYEDLRSKDFFMERLEMLGLASESPPAVASSKAGTTPALVVEAKLLSGGVILCVWLHHYVSDMTGIGVFLKTWARNTHEERAIEIDPVALDRSMINRLGSYIAILANFKSAILAYLAFSKDSAPTPTPPEREIITLHFSHDSLLKLKATVTKHIVDIPYISTNDALCALLWSCITTANNPTAKSASLSTLKTVANIRSRVNPPLPPNYVGNALYSLRPTTTHGRLLAATRTAAALGPIAIAIRRSILGVTDGVVRAIIMGILQRTDPDAAPPRIMSSVLITSWAEQGIMAEEWRGMGKCEAVRPVRRARVSNVATIWPKRLDGGLEVGVALTRDELARLQEMETLGEFAEVIV